MILKLNHDPSGPEKNTGGSIDGDIKWAVVTVDDRFSLRILFAAYVVIHNLHVTKQERGITIPAFQAEQ